MKIKTATKSYDEVAAIKPKKRIKPKKPNILFRTVLKVGSLPDLLAVRFKLKKIGMDRLGKKEPCLILMNHSSFIDLKIASSVLYPRAFNIVCTSDGFVGKRWLMRNLGCIPTQKFVSDVALVRDMIYATKTLKSSVLMYPEASYSFDGTATPLPDTIGKCVKLLGVPVVMLRTYGAFARDPLYNNLQRRRVKVSADLEYILSPDDIEEKSADEINEIIFKQFDFDNFRWQLENKILVKEKFRADGLNKVLYKCPHCLSEGKTVGKGTTVCCESCGEGYLLGENGQLSSIKGETKFSHIPDWYKWERECVKNELLDGSYGLNVDVDICMMADMKKIYRVGSGTLTHSVDGFHLVGCDGKLDYKQKPTASYSLYSDYFWYEIGDMICIGNSKVLYYCFPKNSTDIVAKTRLAVEELYKIVKSKNNNKKP